MLPAQPYSMRPLDERIFDLSSWPYVLARMCSFGIARVVLYRRLLAKTTKCAYFCDSVSTTLYFCLSVYSSTAVANNDTTLITDSHVSGPPTLRGYLNKYTNVARGYSTRWFVLKDGVLSCTLLCFSRAALRSFTENVRLSSPRGRTSCKSWFHLDENSNIAFSIWR